MSKMFIFTPRVKTDRKLTVVNKITRICFCSNLKVSTTKSQKKKIPTLTKEKLLFYQPIK